MENPLSSSSSSTSSNPSSDPSTLNSRISTLRNIPTDPIYDPATRQRITTHLNYDHQDSLSLYLSHYHRLSPFTARRAWCTDISLTSLTIATSGKEDSATYAVPFEPPLESFRDARDRFVVMDKEAKRGLGRSDIRVTEYIPPSGLNANTVGAVVTVLIWLAIATPLPYLPGFPTYDYGFRYVPAVAAFMRAVRGYVLTFFIVAHGAEAGLAMVRVRLTKHNVKVLSWVWCAWVVGTFVEGVWSMKRFDALVERKELELGRKKG
ncbi:MAG: hypothetical protein M1827_005154 [Pycnora praestabilis]|nr:MAG: hypothetical protein M1827_005154 [Pycnora praestabilis]